MDFVETMKLSLHTKIIFLFAVVFSSSVFSAGDALIGQVTRSDLENSAHKKIPVLLPIKCIAEV